MKILKWLPAFFIVAVSWHLSSLEHIEQMPAFWGADKLVHFVCFAGLSFWFAFALDICKIRWTYIPSCLTSLYGIIDEIHQSFVPLRECSIVDWIADTIGAVVGALIFVLIIKLIAKFKKN